MQILPITELPESQSSPYSALTAMALDPDFISLPAVEDFEALGGEAQLPDDDRRALEAIRKADHVDLSPTCGRSRGASCGGCIERFVEHEVARRSERAEQFRAFVAAEASVAGRLRALPALHARHSGPHGGNGRSHWRAGLHAALTAAVTELADEIDYRKYLQWVAATQWAQARREAQPTLVFGDVPFMISADSPDVWTRQHEFRFDATVGVPPDAFSETGQDWGCRPGDGTSWRRTTSPGCAAGRSGQRASSTASGSITWSGSIAPTCARWTSRVPPFFAPPDPPTQAKLGEKLVSLYRDTGAEVIAEDLGTVPDFVRASLQTPWRPRFQGDQVGARMEGARQAVHRSRRVREASVATTGTHDTEPMVTWWKTAPAGERRAVQRMPSVKRHRAHATSPLDAVLRALLDAPSRLTIIPLQDVFGWSDRINTPAQITADNWSWMLPWRVDRMLDQRKARDRAAVLAQWTREANR